VVQRVAGLVQERLVVVQAALRPRDQVDDARRVARDHARARRLLGTVVEIELDVRLRREIEAELGQRGEAYLGRALLRVGRLERREPAHVRGVEARRHLLALRPEQLLEPALAQRRERKRRVVARGFQRRRQLVQGDALLLLVALDRVGDARELGRELLAGCDQLEPVGVEARARVGLELAELLAIGIGRQHRELRLRVPKRHLLAAERDPLCEQPVLELVLLLDERGRDEPALARLAEPVEQLALLARSPFLRLTQRLELLPAEEVGVAPHDLRLLGRLLLADADRAPLLGALVEIAREALLELRGCANRGDRQSRRTLADEALRSRDERGGVRR